MGNVETASLLTNAKKFAIIMASAMSHAYGCCNPKKWADYLEIKPQKIYPTIKTWSLYRLKELLIKMMVY